MKHRSAFEGKPKPIPSDITVDKKIDHFHKKITQLKMMKELTKISDFKLDQKSVNKESNRLTMVTPTAGDDVQTEHRTSIMRDY